MWRGMHYIGHGSPLMCRGMYNLGYGGPLMWRKMSRSLLPGVKDSFVAVMCSSFL